MPTGHPVFEPTEVVAAGDENNVKFELFVSYKSLFRDGPTMEVVK